MSKRVVITGMGVISPLGNDVETSWQNAVAGKSGIAKVEAFDVSDYPSQIGGEVKNFDPESIVEKKLLRRYDRYSLLALSAAREAWQKAAVPDAYYPANKMGIILGVGIGGLRTLEDNHTALSNGGPRRVSPFLIPAMISNIAPGNIAIELQMKGVNYTVTSACTSGTHAIGEGYSKILAGQQDLVICGGAEGAITPLGLAGFGRMKALSTRNDDPGKASRPFDRDRDGFVIGEGAGLVVLEELERAKERGANIIAEVAGYGYSCDAYHITAPPEGGEGAISCMQGALESAGVRPEQVGYINAHGTSTPINDPAESLAIKSVFGTHAKDGLLVSSTKSMTGHLLGAAGGVEAVFSALALKTSVIPPTVNLENPAEHCDLDYVAQEAREASIDVAISNSFGFGGTNATVLLKRYE